MVVYDTTCHKSFEDIEKFWFNEIESYAEKDVLLLLLGNKSDLDGKKDVSTEKVRTLTLPSPRCKSTRRPGRWSSSRRVPRRLITYEMSV